MRYSHRNTRTDNPWRLIVALSAVALSASLICVAGCGMTAQPLPSKSAGAGNSANATAENGEENGAETVGDTDLANQGSSSTTQEENASSKPGPDETTKQDAKTAEPKWIGQPDRLLKNDSLDGWEVLNFGGEGDCEVANGVLTLEAGDPFTGVSVDSEDLPKTNYEVSLVARKTEGIDFFCGLTFPVAESHCTLIVGGWGGGLVGLSCIDDQDASQNDTQSVMKFEKKQWYKIRVRVQPENISAWIDEKQVVNKNIKGKKISVRGDVTLCTPLGVCSFQTDAEIKDIQIRQFKPMAAAPAGSSSTKSSPEK